MAKRLSVVLPILKHQPPKQIPNGTKAVDNDHCRLVLSQSVLFSHEVRFLSVRNCFHFIWFSASPQLQSALLLRCSLSLIPCETMLFWCAKFVHSRQDYWLLLQCHRSSYPYQNPLKPIISIFSFWYVLETFIAMFISWLERKRKWWKCCISLQKCDQ